METCCRFLCAELSAVKLRQNKQLIILLESPHGIRFENVYMYSKSLQQLKYRYLENLLTPIEEIGYFTFFNNNDVLSPPNEALSNSIFVFVTCDKQDAKRVLCDGSTRGLLLSVSDIRKAETFYTR